MQLYLEEVQQAEDDSLDARRPHTHTYAVPHTHTAAAPIRITRKYFHRNCNITRSAESLRGAARAGRALGYPS